MTRVGVMTFLHNDNYGSTLQAYALQKTLLSMGLDVEHIDYCPNRAEKLRNLLKSGNSPRLVLEGMRKRAVASTRPGAKRKHESFPAFYQANMKLSSPCRNHAALKKQAECHDQLVCGSDQIWSPLWLNPAYFLDFALPEQRCSAYAASLGVEAMPEARKSRRIRALTERFSHVSVREEEGAALLKKMTGRSADVMPDPVCLLTADAWRAIAKKPDVQSPYLLCYFIGDSPLYWEKVAAIAAETGLAVRVVPVTENAYQQGYPLADGLSPEEWLGWLDGAARVVTDSFHGTVFSAILQRPFTVVKRDAEDNPESKNSRINHLMRQLDITGQEEDFSWAKIDARLTALREKGIAWLHTALTEVH